MRREKNGMLPRQLGLDGFLPDQVLDCSHHDGSAAVHGGIEELDARRLLAAGCHDSCISEVVDVINTAKDHKAPYCFDVVTAGRHIHLQMPTPGGEHDIFFPAPIQHVTIAIVNRDIPRPVVYAAGVVDSRYPNV